MTTTRHALIEEKTVTTKNYLLKIIWIHDKRYQQNKNKCFYINDGIYKINDSHLSSYSDYNTFSTMVLKEHVGIQYTRDVRNELLIVL